MNIEQNKLNIDMGAFWPNPDSDLTPNLPIYEVFRSAFPEKLADLSWQSQVRMLATTGIMAPSSHNMQQWKLVANEQQQTLTIHPDTTYIGIPADMTGREAYISVGNMTETMIQCLHAYALVPKVELKKQTVPKSPLTEIVFHLNDLAEGTLQDSDLLKLIQWRRVYRGAFDRYYHLPASVQQMMENMGEEIGLQVKLVTDYGVKTALGLFQYTANNIVLHQPDFRRELGEFLLPNDSQSDRGMSGASFGLNDADADEAHKELLEGGKLQGKFATGFPNADKNAIISSAATIVVLAPQDNENNWIKSGMLMDRLWLYAQSQGLGVGVMAGMVEVAGMARKLVGTLGGKGVPTVVLRMGKPIEKTWARSPRTQLEKVLTFE